MASTVVSAKVQFRKVLVAIDFSESSQKALRYAVTIARSYGAKFYMVNVVSALGFKMAGPDATAMAEEVVSHDIQNLETFLAESGALSGIEHHAVVKKNGEVWKTLEAFIEENDIDLTVVGTHGRSGLSKIAFGSVAEAVFHHSICPVVTVGPDAPEMPPANAKLTHILYPTDLSPESACAAAYTVSLALQHDARLTIVHIVDQPALMTTDQQERDFEDHLRESAGGELPHNWTFRTQLGRIDDTILELAEQGRVGLIVLGLRSFHTLRKPHNWPHAYKIAVEACCPVLTIRCVDR